MGGTAYTAVSKGAPLAVFIGPHNLSSRPKPITEGDCPFGLAEGDAWVSPMMHELS